MTDQELKDLVASLVISQQKTDEQMKKTDEQMKKTDEQMKNTNEQLKQTDERLEQKLTRLGIHLGGVTKSQGKVTEEFFYNSLKEHKTIANIKYDEIFKNLQKDKDNISDEYDMLLVNGKDILIIETKYRTKTKDLNKLINKKYKNFKKLFPIYENYNHHLALASFQIEDSVKEKALKKGVLVLQRKGELVESFLPS